jgi:hypothetical protein
MFDLFHEIYEAKRANRKNGKLRGFRKDFALTKAKMMKRSGAKAHATISFLCQKGFHRARAAQIEASL